MFTRWGDLVHKLRFAVIGVVAAALLALGYYGLGVNDHLSSSGFDDPTSQSTQAARISDASYGRDHNSDVLVLYAAPEGKTIDDPEFKAKVLESLNRLPEQYPDQIAKVNGAYWQTKTGPAQPSLFGSKDKKYTFASLAIVGDNDTDMVRNYRAVKDVFGVPGITTEVAGLQPVAGTLNDTIAHDSKRMEVIAFPAVAVLLFFIFGGIVAAGLPLIVGGLTIIGANGIVMLLTRFTEVNNFVGNIVSMIGLGLAIDYGLFIVSRFREELAEGYDTKAAVRRTVMTAGRTVVFSATMIVASLAGLLLFPQGFLKSIAYGAIATVTLAALTSITILPAMLAVLGKRVDWLGLKAFRKTKTAEEVENGFWGRSTRWVMQHPLKIAVPITIILLLLIIPVKNLAFGGINERYLPPDNSTRLAQQHFDEIFPLRKTDPIMLIFVSPNSGSVGKVWKEANAAPGLAGPFEVPSRSTKDSTIYRTTATLADSENYDPTIEYLRDLDVPDDVQMYVGGTPAMTKDSIDALVDRMPMMIALVLGVTMLLMFLTFGSLVLPIKAALMSALGLGSTLGILTWIFIDGHGSGLLNFTPQPIMSPILVLIIAVVYGLSVDYEVFLLSRMVEARAQGASTTEAVRIGTAQTGRIITAAALILLVVVGAFAFSDLVMMQYLAYGMVAALLIDATILRMLLVPATMKLLGDDCWWAPKWMKKVQQKIGLGEPILDDERPGGGELVDLVKTTPVTDPVTMVMPAVADGDRPRSPRRPRTVAEIEAEAPTQRLDKVPPVTQPTPPRTPQVLPPKDSPRVLPPQGQTDSARVAPGQSDAAHISPQGQSDSTRVSPQHGQTDSARVSLPHGPADSARVSPSHGQPDSARATPAQGQPDSARATPPQGQPDSARLTPPHGQPDATRGSAPQDHTDSPRVSPRPDSARGASPQSQPDSARVLPPQGQPDSVRAVPPQGRPDSARVLPPQDSARVLPPQDSARVLPPQDSARVRPPQGPAEPPRPGPTQPTPMPAAPDPTRPRVAPPVPSPELARRVPPAPEPEPANTEPFTPEPQAQPTHHHAAEEPDATPDDSRSSIENWMAELRSSRRRIAGAEPGRHSGADGRTVSVNELLRRREEE
ncbi:MMPL family transporter [Nocardia sp. NPDC048505]|uniref:MMPL family transporter n=1 Tax=unclassified Nocardia TaxID=2637762 RepID=UPI0033CABF02